MRENQNVEWKESWRDEYIKVICSFANAQGGLLLVGVNDKGEVTGVEFPSKVILRSGKRVGEKVGEKGRENLSDNQKEIIENIKKKQYITAEQLSKVIGISTRKIESNLRKLREKNIIERIGPSRGGYWKINK